MTDSVDIGSRIDALPELRSVLDDLNVKYVTIAFNGHWSFEKLGRSRQGSDPFDREILRQIASLIPPGRQVRSGEWALRKYDGVSGASILIERLPVAVADRLPQDVLAALKRQVKRSGNGVLVGEPGSGKGALLLWLALQMPDEPVLYVAENPPSDFPGHHVMHVFPPSTQAERRALERFVRLSPTVMWDRVASPQDLMTLYGFPGAGRRWFTLDSSSVRSALRMLTAATQNGSDARFSTLLHLSSSVIGRPEARNLLLRSEEGWREAYLEGESAVALLEAFDGSDVRLLQSNEVSRPGIALDEMEPKVEVDPDFVREAESIAKTSAQAPVEERAPPPAPPSEPREETANDDLNFEFGPDGGHAAPFDPAPAVAASDSRLSPPSTADQDDDYDHPHTVEVDVGLDEESDAITGMLAREEMRELREKQLDSLGEDGIPSMNVDEMPEVTRSYIETPEEIAPHKSAEGDSSYLQRIVPDLDEPPAPPDVNLSDLRITTMEDVDEADLEILDIDDEELSEVDDDDFSGVFDGELDFESLAEEMMSEMSEVEAETQVGSAAHYSSQQTNPERVVLSEDDLRMFNSPDETSDEEQNHTISATADVLKLAQSMQPAQEPEESTKEFTLNERLMMLRQRQNDD